MVGQSDGRTVGRSMRVVSMVIGVILLSIGPTVRRSDGQVGHDPASSPYRDVRLRSGPSFFVGEFNGGRGSADAAFSHARPAALRDDLPAGQTLLPPFISHRTAQDIPRREAGRDAIHASPISGCRSGIPRAG